jgi:malate dehydrogenase (oxaloacetate-decarboxylating)(NADP+)
LDGVIYKGRTVGMNPYKERFARDTKFRDLAEAVAGADVLVGLSGPKAISKEMVASMAKNPIIFAMANPEPEILPSEVLEVRDDAIMATGRSDFPNQVNNVLGYPFIFRGALDTGATQINEEMKMAAVKALAALAKFDVPDNVSKAYGGAEFAFGRNYLIPKPFDQRALLWVSPAVAKAAMDTGVATKRLDLESYKEELEEFLGGSARVMRTIKQRLAKGGAGKKKLRIVFPEGDHPKILKACAQIKSEGYAEPILLGRPDRIYSAINGLGLDDGLRDVEIIEPVNAPNFEAYAKKWSDIKERKGITIRVARELLVHRNYYGSMMVECGDADGLVSGVSQSYPETIRPALQIVGSMPGKKLAGIYMMIVQKQVFFFADTTVNIDPTAEDLADIAIMTAELSKTFVEDPPRVAMLSFSNFGSNRHELARKVAQAAAMAKAKAPHLILDGEMQADTALVPEILLEDYPFSDLKEQANILIFPDLQSGNIAYKLMMRMGQAEAIGPILVGMRKPVNVLQQNCGVDDIVKMTLITAVECRSGVNFGGNL